MTVRPVGDLRRHVAAVSNSALTFLVVVQEALDDVEGGVAAEQWELVAAQTRHVVLACLHARGLRTGAEPYFWDDGGSGDPTTGVPEQDVATGFRLIATALALPDAGAEDFLDQLHGFVDASERTVGLTEQLPELRSPQGMFGGLRLVRGWQPLVAELGLPPMLPGEWTKPL